MRLFLAALVLIGGAIPAEAQWLDRPTPNIPRTSDGKPNLAAPAPRGADGHPDLTGRGYRSSTAEIFVSARCSILTGADQGR